MNGVALNPGFAELQPYPFEKLSALLAGITPEIQPAIPLSIGEPRHAPPEFVLERYRDTLTEGVSRYPTIKGTDALRAACAEWIQRRFSVAVDPTTMVHPVNGTREALFAFAQAFVTPGQGQLVLLPNPFYQIYEGAALMAGAEPAYINVSPEQDFLPDLDALEPDLLRRALLFYLCSPVNPCGTVASIEYLERLAQLAVEYDFIVAADECYIELFREHPPASMLCAARSERIPFENIMTFHSLSKRSNLPGLRSGFVAGDPRLIRHFGAYRTYHGCSMSLAVQHASIAAWEDDRHVQENRAIYNRKYAMAEDLLAPAIDIDIPPAAFYLWPNVGSDDVHFCRELYRRYNVTAVPGSYLARTIGGHNPGTGFVRLSLVADVESTKLALQRLTEFLEKGT